MMEVRVSHVSATLGHFCLTPVASRPVSCGLLRFWGQRSRHPLRKSAEGTMSDVCFFIEVSEGLWFCKADFMQTSCD